MNDSEEPSSPEPSRQLVDQPIIPGTPAWHAMRRTGMGGSDVAAALDLSPWKSAYELYLEKIGEKAPGETSDPMRFGTLFEPVIIGEYGRRTGFELSRPEMIRSAEYPWLLANPDGIAFGRGQQRIVEVKTSRSAENWGPVGSDEVPLGYRLQVEMYLICTKLAIADLVVLIAGSDFRIYTIEGDPEMQALIVDATRAFWQRVVDRNPPPIVKLDDARRRWGSLSLTNTKAVVANEQQLEAHAQLCALTAQQRQLDEHESALKVELMSAMGDQSDTLVDTHGKTLATWKMPKSHKHFDAERFEVENPALFAQYQTDTKPSRRLLIKEPKS